MEFPQLVPIFDDTPGKKLPKKVFLTFNWNFSCCSLRLLPLTQSRFIPKKMSYGQKNVARPLSPKLVPESYRCFYPGRLWSIHPCRYSKPPDPVQRAPGGPAWAGDLDQMTSGGPFQPQIVCVSVILYRARHLKLQVSRSTKSDCSCVYTHICSCIGTQLLCVLYFSLPPCWLIICRQGDIKCIGWWAVWYRDTEDFLSPLSWWSIDQQPKCQSQRNSWIFGKAIIMCWLYHLIL